MNFLIPLAHISLEPEILVGLAYLQAEYTAAVKITQV